MAVFIHNIHMYIHMWGTLTDLPRPSCPLSGWLSVQEAIELNNGCAQLQLWGGTGGRGRSGASFLFDLICFWAAFVLNQKKLCRHMTGWQHNIMEIIFGHQQKRNEEETSSHSTRCSYVTHAAPAAATTIADTMRELKILCQLTVFCLLLSSSSSRALRHTTHTNTHTRQTHTQTRIYKAYKNC